MELFLSFDILGKEPIPFPEAFGKKKLSINVGSLHE
jgi:hypothetical protein